MQHRLPSDQEKSIATRAGKAGLTLEQARSHYAESIEGRLYLRSPPPPNHILTRPQADAIAEFRRRLERHNRQIGAPQMPGNPLARYLPAEPALRHANGVPLPDGAAAQLAREKADAAMAVVARCSRPAQDVLGALCCRNVEPPEHLYPALQEVAQALAYAFNLEDWPRPRIVSARFG